MKYHCKNGDIAKIPGWYGGNRRFTVAGVEYISYKINGIVGEIQSTVGHYFCWRIKRHSIHRISPQAGHH